MDSCLLECSSIATGIYKFMDEKIGIEQNYISFACDFMYTSIAFVWLHEISHYHLDHKIDINKSALQKEIEADNIAYNVFLKTIEKNKQKNFQGGIFTEVFYDESYLAPVMILDFYHTITLVEKILYDATIDNSLFDKFITRKSLIIDYIEKSPYDVDTDIGNQLYGAFRYSLDSFIRLLVSTEKDGRIDKLKFDGGWFENE